MQNYVGQALQNLSGTVEGIGRQAGDNRLKLSELGLKRAAYEMGLPELSLKRDKALDETARRNQPVNVKILMQKDNPESIFHILGSQTTKNMPPPYQAVGNIFGATVDEQGNYIVDGRPLTNWEFNQKAAQVQRTMGFYTDPKKAMETRANMAQRSIDSGIDTRTGQPIDDKMKANLAGGIEKVGKMTDADYLRGYQQQLADMEASKAPFIDGGGSTTLIDAAIGRVQGKIDSYKAAVAKTADRTYNEGRDRIKQGWELDKIDRRNTGNVSNAANKIKANNLKYRQDMLKNVNAQMKPILELNPAMTPEQQKKQRAIFKARYINDTRGVQVQPIQNEQTGQTQFWDGKQIVNEFLEPIQIPQIIKPTTIEPTTTGQSEPDLPEPKFTQTKDARDKEQFAELKEQLNDAYSALNPEQVQTFDAWAAENPTEASTSVGVQMLNAIKNMSSADKAAIQKRRKLAAQRAFTSTSPLPLGALKTGDKYTGDLEKLRKIYPNLSEKELLEMAQQL